MSGKDSTTGQTIQAAKRATDGRIAERLAGHFLEQQGLTILECNYRCRGGEVDLVCRDRRGLVFVEVRLRRSAGYGGAAASITAGKRERIILAAQHYLATHAAGDADCRFDCVLLDDLSESAIEWLRDAFC